MPAPRPVASGRSSTRRPPSPSASCRSTRGRASAATACRATRYYLSWRDAARRATRPRFIAFADEINGGMPALRGAARRRRPQRSGQAGEGLAHPRRSGVAYKAGVGDVRDSPALEIIDALLARGAQRRLRGPARAADRRWAAIGSRRVSWAQRRSLRRTTSWCCSPRIPSSSRRGSSATRGSCSTRATSPARWATSAARHPDLSAVVSLPDRRAGLAPPAAVGEEPLRLRRPHLLAEPVHARSSGRRWAPSLIFCALSRGHLPLQRRGRRREGPAASREAPPARRRGRALPVPAALGLGVAAAGGQPRRRLLAVAWASGWWPLAYARAPHRLLGLAQAPGDPRRAHGGRGLRAPRGGGRRRPSRWRSRAGS